jgi:RNA polymerase sigma-70 factor (ECF subfamily)
MNLTAFSPFIQWSNGPGPDRRVARNILDDPTVYFVTVSADPKARALWAEDLALANACAEGDEAAWERFVLTYRPILYRAADALDPTGGAREVADSLYAELFGIRGSSDERQSLFRYFQGRSSLATWLRAVLSQRYVDRIRANRRLETLPDDEGPAPLPAPASASFTPDRRLADLIQRAFVTAVGNLENRDRLRLACYYAQDLTLAQTGRLLGEHEATCSRQLARTRKSLRADVERQLRADGLDDRTIAECVALLTEDTGTLDLKQLLGPSLRKNSTVDRSR